HQGFVTAVNGNFDAACAALQEMYAHRLQVPATEESLLVIYNEYCWSWGNPDLEKMKPVIDECARLGVGIFVVDCGWWLTEGDSWYTLGDWNVNKKAFPNGIRECADLIKSKGMIPGVWFEFEALSTDSQLFKEHRDWCLTRDGHTVINRERALLDFRKPEVRAYATEKTIDFLRDNGFGYMKLDYNEGLGIGCDGAESYGEGMRQHIECVLAFLKEVKRALPDLIIEICSSGGHRLEPLFLSIGSQASFSDEHLDADGALIAADLHRYMLPRQMQVWATLEPAYDIERTYFTLAKGMTGRFCLSGNLCALSDAQKKAMEQSVPFYNKIKPIVKNGVTRINENRGITSYKHPKGLRYMIRFSPDGAKAVLWLFNFGKGKSACVTNEVLADYDILDSYAYGKVEKKGNGITVTQPKANELLGAAVLLQKKQ
ncbi:MAG: alpha-galactosidase, partial [Clostridiales bacterium]|nr:alpha-galactosidase [Clostridiales bacterium]